MKAAPQKSARLVGLACKMSPHQRKTLLAAHIHPMGQVVVYPPSSGKLKAMGVITHVRDSIHQITPEGTAIAATLQPPRAR